MFIKDTLEIRKTLKGLDGKRVMVKHHKVGDNNAIIGIEAKGDLRYYTEKDFSDTISVFGGKVTGKGEGAVHDTWIYFSEKDVKTISREQGYITIWLT